MARIFTEDIINNSELLRELHRLGNIELAYPYCDARIDNLETLYRIAAIFEKYGYDFIVDGRGWFVAKEKNDE